VSLVVPGWFGYAPDVVPADQIGLAHGVRRVVPILVWRGAQSVMLGLALLFALLVLRLALPSQRLAMIALAVVGAVAVSLPTEHFWLWFLMSLVMNALLIGVLRVGLLAAVVAFYVSGLFYLFPVTADLDAWYAGAGFAAIATLGAFVLFGFRTALAGRPALGRTSGD
jgi:hypothetical protein